MADKIQMGIAALLFLLYNICTVTAIYRYKSCDRSKSVYLPPFILILGWIASVPLTALAIASVIFSWGIGAVIGFLVFSLLGGSLVIACCNCWIQYDKTGFQTRRFWGICHRYRYQDITGFSLGGKDSVVYLKKGKIHIDENAYGKAAFLSVAKKQYRKYSNNSKKHRKYSNNSNGINDIYRKDDFFHGNIENPGEFILLFFLVLAFFLGTGIFVTVLGLQPIKESELETAAAVFAAYREEEEDLICISADNGEEWIFYHYQTYVEHTEKLLSDIENQEAFTICYRTYENEDETAYHKIFSCTGMDGTVFLTIEQGNAQQREGWYIVVLIFGGLILLLIVFAAFFTHIVRNAQDHPKLTPLLVKKDYIIKH